MVSLAGAASLAMLTNPDFLMDGGFTFSSGSSGVSENLVTNRVIGDLTDFREETKTMQSSESSVPNGT